MTIRTHILIGAVLFAASAAITYFWPEPKLTTFVKNHATERISIANPSPTKSVSTTENGGIIQPSKAPSTTGYALSVRVDPDYVFDYQTLRREALDKIEWDRINQIPHHYDFWQNLSRSDLIKWTNIEAGLPGYSDWLLERNSLMMDYNQSTDPFRKSQILEALRLNQAKRVKITETVIAMAKAEDSSLGQPRTGKSDPRSENNRREKETQPVQPEKPKLFQ